MSAIAGILVWDPVAKKIVLAKAWSDLDYSQVRTWSRAEHLGKIGELERSLADLDGYLNDFEDLFRMPPQSP